MSIATVRKLFSTHKGNEKKILKLMNFAFDFIDKKKKFCYISPSRQKPDYETIVEGSVFPEKGLGEEKTIRKLLKNYSSVVNVAHPRTQVNVNPPPTDVSIVASALGAKYNENAVWDFIGKSSAISEVMAIGMVSDLIGYNRKKAGGVFTFGGSASNIYAGKIGIAKVAPKSGSDGLNGKKIYFICSASAHYSIQTAASWLGIGLKNVISIPCNENNEMDLSLLEKQLRFIKKQRGKLACVYATIGTTDAFGVDPVLKIRRLLQKHKMNTHIHADAVIGWTYLNFNGYDFSLIKDSFIRREIKEAYMKIKQVKHADSIGIDFHKTGWANYITSCFVVKQKKDFNLIMRDKETTPYLFHGHGYHPGLFTLECSRPNYAQKALVNIWALGKEGYRDLIIHLFTLREYFRSRLTEEGIIVLNPKNHFFVTDFRVYPFPVDSDYFEKEISGEVSSSKVKLVNEYNRRVIKALLSRSLARESSIFSSTEHFLETSRGQRIVCLKSYPMSPFTEKTDMEKALNDLLSVVPLKG